jgi:hypothetical protein
MLRKGSAYGRLAKTLFVSKYPSPNLIPPEEMDYFVYLEQQNRLWFTKAESLGWREPGQDQEAQYIQTINRAKFAQ